MAEQQSNQVQIDENQHHCRAPRQAGGTAQARQCLSNDFAARICRRAARGARRQIEAELEPNEVNVAIQGACCSKRP